jgi:hypothetical protein
MINIDVYSSVTMLPVEGVRNMNIEKPRVLVLSHRNVAPPIPARCLWYEFEDIIHEIDAVDILSPGQQENFEIKYRRAARVGRRFPLALNPGVVPYSVDKEYELFFTVCAFPQDLLYVNALKGWRKRCKTAICWVDELLLQNLWYVRSFQKLISQFDVLVVSCKQLVDRLQLNVSENCHYRLPGIDALLFCPYPEVPQRSIDVLSIGRRSKKVHNELLALDKKGKMFYLYDTFSSFGCKYGITVYNTEEHRLLLSNLCKRSRYFTVLPGKFDEMGNSEQDIIGSRFVEGAASGAIMIGRRPETEDFSAFFPWPNAVIDLFEKNMTIEDVIANVDNNRSLQCQIRTSGIVHSLRRHDWVHRWRDILEIAGVEPMPGLLERERQVNKRADLVELSSEKQYLCSNFGK